MKNMIILAGLGFISLALAGLTFSAVAETLIDSDSTGAATSGHEAHRHGDGKSARVITKMSQQEIAQGRLFLEANAHKTGVVRLPSGLQYSIENAGSGKAPVLGDSVSLVYEGRTIEGRTIGHSLKEGKAGPQEYAVKELIPGLREAVLHMHEGDRWTIYVPPDLGFRRGSSALEQRALVYDVELRSVLSAKNKLTAYQ